jgi:hypothetical protein
MVVFASATMTSKKGNKTLYRYIFEEIVMKKKTLLSITLLLCPGLIFSMNPKSFPKVNNSKKIRRSNNIPIQKQSNNTDSFSVLEEQKIEEINDSSQEVIIIDTVNEIVPNDTRIEDNDQSVNNFLIESSSPVEQEKRGFFGKLWAAGKSYRDLSLYWLSQKEIPTKTREQAQNDVKWGITEENKAIKINRNNNEDFVTILKNCEKKSSHRHETILKMAAYLKKNEDHTQHLDKFVHADEKGLPFDNSQILEDTYKMLQSEDKHDLFMLGLITLEVMNRVGNRQNTRNHIYTQTKDNKKVVGHLSDKDYTNPQVVYQKTQLLMKEVIGLKNKQEQEEKLKEEQKNKTNDKK